MSTGEFSRGLLNFRHCRLAFGQDASELLARGIQLIPIEARGGREGAAAGPAAWIRNFQCCAISWGLRITRSAMRADAEAELSEAAGHAPDSAAAHNYLGIVLFQLGNAKAALEEFRVAEKLAPKDPNAHFNLGEAFARTGDSNRALEELRIAAGLTPTDAGLTRLLKTVETALAPESTIKVDVRQVLVPVVVKDREGHHMTGLSQADFKVFEDGVEQKITAFSVESSGVAQVSAA